MRYSLIITLVLFLPALGFSATIYVPDAPYTTIQSAINAASSGDTIIVRSDTVNGGPYKENIVLPNIDITVVSESGAALTTIDGRQLGSVVMYGTSASSASILDGFTITNGSATNGGGIDCSSSSPTLQNLTIVSNSANSGGGIYVNGGTPTITGSTFSSNQASSLGGAICSYSGGLNVTDCEFYGNDGGGYGGAIYYQGASLTLESCSIYDNECNNWGGGVCGYSASSLPTTVKKCYIYDNSGSYGGGLYFENLGDILLVNNMIHGNSASYGGGLYLENSTSSRLTNNTLSLNRASSQGGGIYCHGSESPEIYNSILWDNAAPTGPEIYPGSGTPTVDYCDIEGSSSESSWTWLGENCKDANPYFYQANENDFRIVAISPCKEAGSNIAPSVPDKDIEGDDRPFSDKVDMGADEWTTQLGIGEPRTYTVPGDYATIQAAIDGAYPTDTINVTASPVGFTNIDFKGRAVTIQNATDAAITLNGGQAGSVVTFDKGEGADSVLDGFTITNGRAANGGGIHCNNSSSPTLLNLIINNNSATSYGGGIYCRIGDLSLDGFEITNNTASDHGGGIYMNNSTLTVTGSTFSTNETTSGRGGGIYLYSGSLDLSSSQLNANEAGNWGGAICTDYGALNVTGCDLYGNDGGGYGGAIYYQYGGASLTLERCSIYNNECINWGGGVCGYSASSSPTTVKRCSIYDNSGSHGGGLYFQSLGTVLLVNNLIHGNSAWYGGGLYLKTNASSTLTNNTFSLNSASSYGGGIYCYGSGSPVITNSILWGDTAPDGPEIYPEAGTPTITYCDIQGGTGQTWFDPVTCIDEDPDFANPGADDFHLTTPSPCVDVGNDSDPNLPDKDFEGEPRRWDGDNNGSIVVDMGADEHNNPDLVEFVYIKAAGLGNTVIVGWETASEVDTAGFHIWRADKRNPEESDFVRITGQLIPAEGGPSQGKIYSFIDLNVENGHPYRYKLEDVDLNGESRFSDPVMVRWWMPGLLHR